ncbi:hypothetical protein [Clostridium sp.]|uniref:hypothetical protein n=1 Tax=Clostridium sp. TaxID=1506 RepID=UPI0026341359|nr:hypothetical protein [uncultured Clostridium sp.]
MEDNYDQAQNGIINNQPMTLKDWVLTYLLLLIPIANIVLMFVWAFGKNVNKSKKTLFQAQLIFSGIGLVLTLCAMFFIVVMGAGMNSGY